MPYTARIRWRRADPTFEIETTHTGFATAEEAALFANAIPPEAPQRLRVFQGRTKIFSGEDVEITLPFDIKVWVLRPEAADQEVVTDEDFLSLDLFNTPLPDLDDEWEPSQYGVSGTGGAAVNVSLELDEQGRLHVTIEDLSAEDDLGQLSFSLAANYPSDAGE
jgi:hypothetical protein